MHTTPSPGPQWDRDDAQDEADEAAQQSHTSRRAGPQYRRTLYWGLAAVVLAVFVVAAWWLARAPVHTQVISYDVVDNSRIDLTFEITKDPLATVTCQVSALSASFAVVGVQDVTVAPTQLRTSTVKVMVPTQELAATARVDACR